MFIEWNDVYLLTAEESREVHLDAVIAPGLRDYAGGYPVKPCVAALRSRAMMRLSPRSKAMRAPASRTNAFGAPARVPPI